MSQVKESPRDERENVPVPQDETAEAPSTWPKEARDAFLRKAQAAKEYEKQVAELQRKLQDFQGKISELERELQGRDSIIASLSQQQQTVPPQYTQPYQGLPQTGVYQPEAKWDPWDAESVERYLNQKLDERDRRLLQYYQQEQMMRDQMYQWMVGVSNLWSAQLNQLQRRDPNLGMKEIQALFDHARKTGNYDLEKVYEDVFKDRIIEAEKRRAIEEARKMVEEEMRRQQSQRETPPPVMGPGVPAPRRQPSAPPRSYAEATEQALKEYMGKIITE